ncbi:MAG: hypothetical protein ABIH03_11240 [Pseudomonadota bacterium]
MTDSDAGSNNLAGFAWTLLTQAKTDRTAILEPTWTQCYAAATANQDYETETWKKKEQPASSVKKRTWKSKTYFDVTRQKITTAHSLVTDTLFRGGRLPFMLDADERSPMVKQLVAERDAQQQQIRAQGGDPDEIVDTLQVNIEQNEDLITREAEFGKAQQEIGKAIMFGSTYGKMVLKSYVTTMREKWWDMPWPGVMVQQEDSTDTKAIYAVSPWNFWWDLQSGSLDESDFMFERMPANDAMLRKMIGLPNSIDKNILDILAGKANKPSEHAGASDTSTPPGQRNIVNKSRPLELYEGWLKAPRKHVDAFEAEYKLAEPAEPPPQNPEAPTETPNLAGAPDDSDQVYIFLQMLDGKIVSYEREPGEHPYKDDVWQVSVDGISGLGIAESMRDIQTMLNGAIRSFENNVKLLANMIIAVRRDLLTNDPESQIDEGGVLEVDRECEDIRQALQQIVFQDITEPLTKAIEMFLGFSDYISNLPRAEQGQQSQNAQTAFELQQRLDRSGKYLASVVRALDNLIRWTVQQMYDYNAANPDLAIPKLPCVVKALGFSAFENRYLRVQKLMQMLTMALSSQTLLSISDIRWLWEEIGKAQDLEVDQFIKSESEQRADAAQPPTPEEVAKTDAITAKAELDRASAESKRTASALDVATAQMGAATQPNQGGEQ